MSNFSEVRKIGILGGGQLARMMALAAYPLGFEISVLQRKPEHSGMAWESTIGEWDDPSVLINFSRGVDVVTLENEFVDAASLNALELAGRLVYPSAKCIRLVQDKLIQKTTLRAAGLPVPAFKDAPSINDVATAAADWGWPVVLKKRRNGYDGKGNFTVRRAEELDRAWHELDGNRNPLFVEQFCRFERELAVMVTRSRTGDSVVYPVVETIQKDHICHIVQAPAAGTRDLFDRVTELGRAAVEAIDGVGSQAMECFELSGGRIVINEMAPRVHNSGHYTIEGCECSQFENHIRAVAGLPLGSTKLVRPAAAMVNLLGHGEGSGHPEGIINAMKIPGAHFHCYGKQKSVRGRKMGHVTALADSATAARTLAEQAAACIRFGA